MSSTATPLVWLADATQHALPALTLPTFHPRSKPSHHRDDNPPHSRPRLASTTVLYRPRQSDSPPHHPPALLTATIRPTSYQIDKPHRDRLRSGHFDKPPSDRLRPRLHVPTNPALTTATILAHPIRSFIEPTFLAQPGLATPGRLSSPRHSGPTHRRHVFAGVPATSPHLREATHVG